MFIANQQNNPDMFVGQIDGRQINYTLVIYLAHYKIRYIKCLQNQATSTKSLIIFEFGAIMPKNGT